MTPRLQKGGGIRWNVNYLNILMKVIQMCKVTRDIVQIIGNWLVDQFSKILNVTPPSC